MTAEQRAGVRLTDDEREASEQRTDEVLAALDLDHQQFANEGRRSLFGDAAEVIRALLADRAAAEDHGLRAALQRIITRWPGPLENGATCPVLRELRAALALDGDEAGRGGAGGEPRA